jgi:hypothetical protein
VQDGGAVLGFAYHDLMARLRTRGPDDAWTRLQEIIAWYDEVQKAGGPREYYKDTARGSLQGCGKPGGLGIDCEFRESVLVPQVVIRGFLGLEPTATGFSINPALPSTWSELTVDRIHLHNLVLTVRVTRSSITVAREGIASEPFHIELPPGPWTLHYLDHNGDVLRKINVPAQQGRSTVEVDWQDASTIRFNRKRSSPEGEPLTRPTAVRPLPAPGGSKLEARRRRPGVGEHAAATAFGGSLAPPAFPPPVAGLRPFVEDMGRTRARVSHNLSGCIRRERNSQH